MIKQKTIQQTCSLSGTSLHHGLMSRMIFQPARVNSGITFEYGGRVIEVNPGSLFNSSNKFTSLTDGFVKIDCVEHVLSAAAGLGITNLKIILEEDNSTPWLDGSAWPYVQALLAAGLKDQSAPQEAIFLEDLLRVSLGGGDSYIKIYPSQDLTIDCSIRFENLIGAQRFTYPYSPASYIIDICKARSFLPYPLTGNESRTKKRLPGFNWDGLDSNVLVYNDLEYLIPPRFENEPVRHKILDFLGDVAMLGRPLRGYVILYKPCHQLNTLLVKKICEIEGALNPIFQSPAAAFVPVGVSISA